MPAVAITDHGNMYGVKEFFKVAYDKTNFDADGNMLFTRKVQEETAEKEQRFGTENDSDNTGSGKED